MRSYRVSCLPNLEPMVLRELEGLGGSMQDVRVSRGGVDFSSPDLRPSVLRDRLGMASHVSLRLADFRCRALGELERKARLLPWSDWLAELPGPVRVAATTRQSRCYHKKGIEERVARATGRPVATDPDEAVWRLLVRFDRDHCHLTAEQLPPCHRRGYRLWSGKAPLREDLAHAVAAAADWRPEEGEVLLDPFCGSGTLVLEAARRLVGAGREVGTILASDRDGGAAQGAQENAARAGVVLTVQQCAFSEAFERAASHPRGLVLSNPPYGRRVRSQQGHIEALYRRLGREWSGLPAGWRMVLVGPDERLVGATTGAVEQVLFRTRHGGLDVSAMQIGRQFEE